MFHGLSYSKLNESNSGGIDGLSNNIIKNNCNEPSGINRVISGVTNNTESKTERVIHFFDVETTDIPAKKSLLKHLLIGGTILTGVSALAAGGGYYLAGRQNTRHCSENMPLPYFPETSASVDSVLWNVDGGSLTTAGYDLRSEVRPTRAPETSLSPYSYYEKIYGSRATQNQTRQPTSASITDKPEAVSEKTNTTTNPSTSAYMATKQTYAPVIYENQDKVRSTLYHTLMGDDDNPQPLGPIFHTQISDFCHSELIKPAIVQAYEGDEKQRCNILNNMSNIIEEFILDEIRLIDDHDYQKRLTKHEYIEELIIKRKVATLIMAAESIIKNNNFDEFYVEAMKNYKGYSVDEIQNKKSEIWGYVLDNKCIDDYDGSLKNSLEDSYEDSQG